MSWPALLIILLFCAFGCLLSAVVKLAGQSGCAQPVDARECDRRMNEALARMKRVAARLDVLEQALFSRLGEEEQR